MSTFSELFELHISRKGISIAGLGKYCQYDRANLYKVIHGKRNAPDLSFVEMAASYMHLTPAERQEFIEAWHISEIGEGIYLRRKAIRRFILHFPERISTLSRDASQTDPDPLLSGERQGYRVPASEPAFETYVLVDSEAVNSAAYDMITDAFSRKVGTIRLFLQPDYVFLFNLLSSVTSEDSHISVEHIICLDIAEADETNGGACLQLIQDLQRMVPLYQNDLNYQSFYFFDRVQSHYKNLNGLCSMILTESAALLCTSDYRQGLVLHSPEAVTLLHRMFQEYRQSCVCCFQPMSSLDIINSMQSPAITSDKGARLFQAEPDLTPYMDAPLLGRRLSGQLPNRTSYILSMDARFKKQYEAMCAPDFCRYHTLTGIRHFLESGILLNLPRWIYTPFTPEERIRLVKSMLEHCRKRENSFYLLKEPYAGIGLQMHMYMQSSDGRLLFTGRNNDIICLVIREPSLTEAFIDYFDTLDEAEKWSWKESLDMVQALLQEFQERPVPSTGLITLTDDSD